MKRKLRIAAVFLCAALCATALCSCAVRPGKCTLLQEAASAREFTADMSEEENFIRIADSANHFAAAFAEATLRGENDNLAVSPVSVYMALALAAECADNETRQEIADALGLPYETIREDFGTLYDSIARETKTGKISLSNSVWVNEGTQTLPDCLSDLAERYYCDSYSADFRGDNREANFAVRRFVRERTNGLIDKDFDFSKETLFALINALYLKDTWNDSGTDLSLTREKVRFTSEKGKTTSKQFLQGYYESGQVFETESFSSFLTYTENGCRIRFILPQEGYTLADVFTAENIALAASITDYNGTDNINRIFYYTRCIFPEFHTDYDKNIQPVLEEDFGIQKLFDPSACDLSSLIPKTSAEKLCCSKVQHVTDLTVDRTGIEGAAVTVEYMDRSPAVSGDYKKVRQQFVLNKPFGFIISNRYETILFAGTVYTV